MAFLNGLNITGSLGNLSFYTMRGVDRTVVRQKGGPSKEHVKNSPTFKVPRLYMSEFGGCSKMGKEVRLMMHPVRTLADYNFSGFINKALKMVQKQDGTGELGRRSIALSKYPGLLEGFSLNKYTTFDAVVRTPITYTVDRKTLSARVNIPALLRDINFHPNNRHTRFRIEMSLGIVPDFTFDAGQGIYRPAAWYTRMFAPKTISSPWYPALKGSPATALEIALTDQVPANESYSLMLTIGVRYGAPMEDNVVQEVKRAGAAKVLAIAGSAAGDPMEEKQPVDVTNEEKKPATESVQSVAACMFAWRSAARNHAVEVARPVEDPAEPDVPSSLQTEIESSSETTDEVVVATASSAPVTGLSESSFEYNGKSGTATQCMKPSLSGQDKAWPRYAHLL